MTFPREHRTKLHSINPIERINGEIKRRTDVVGISPNDDAIVRLVGPLLLEHNDEWAVQRSRYMTLETIAPLGDDPRHDPAGRHQRHGRGTRQEPARRTRGLGQGHTAGWRNRLGGLIAVTRRTRGDAT